ncbi:MAG: hypothetical protein U1E57_01455 [Paenacidovorax caeni]
MDMVSAGATSGRTGALSRRLPSMLATEFISRSTGVHLHDYGCALKAYRCPIIDRIRLYGELHRFIPRWPKKPAHASPRCRCATTPAPGRFNTASTAPSA